MAGGGRVVADGLEAFEASVAAQGVFGVSVVVEFEGVGVGEVESQRAAVAVDFYAQFVVAAAGDFGDLGGAGGAAARAQEHDGHVVGGDGDFQAAGGVDACGRESAGI